MSSLFLTGFPGNISRRLLPKLLKLYQWEKIILLVKEELFEKARKTLEEIRRNELANEKLPEMEILKGDITKKDLGLLKGTYDRVSQEADVYLNLASWDRLRGPWKTSFAVNYIGTVNLAEMALKNKNVKHFVHFSSIFVAGNYEGEFSEKDLDVGQKFRNPYEKSKFLAEKFLRKRADDLPITIFRPSIVVGSSKDGSIDNFGPAYLFLKFVKNYPSWIPITNPATERAFLNIVPIDYVVDASSVLLGFSGSIGKTYHLVDPSPPDAREAMEKIIELVKGKRTSWKAPKAVLKALAFFNKVELGILDYFEQRLRVKCEETMKDLEKYGVEVPTFNSYYRQIVKYYLENA